MTPSPSHIMLSEEQKSCLEVFSQIAVDDSKTEPQWKYSTFAFHPNKAQVRLNSSSQKTEIDWNGKDVTFEHKAQIEATTENGEFTKISIEYHIESASLPASMGGTEITYIFNNKGDIRTHSLPRKRGLGEPLRLESKERIENLIAGIDSCLDLSNPLPSVQLANMAYD